MTIHYYKIKIEFIIIILLSSCNRENVDNPTLLISSDTTKVQYKDNKPIHSFGLKNGKFNGERFYFDEKDSTTTIDNFYKGELHGEVAVFYNNGKLKLEGNHNMGKKTGVWKYYHEDQKLQQLQISQSPDILCFLAKWGNNGELMKLNSDVKIIRFGEDSILIVRQILADIRLEVMINGQYREAIVQKGALPYPGTADSISCRYVLNDINIPFKRKVLDLKLPHDRDSFLWLD